MNINTPITDFTKCLTAAVKADKQALSVSDTLLSLFKEHGAEVFSDNCLLAENKFKAKCIKAGNEPVIPRSWVQAKSDLKSAHKAGIDISECVSVSQAKNLKIKANKARKEAEALAKLPAPQPASAKSTPLPLTVSEQASGKSYANSTNGKIEELADKLNGSGLSSAVINAMLDSFMKQVDKAVNIEANATTSKPAKTIAASSSASTTKGKRNKKIAA